MEPAATSGGESKRLRIGEGDEIRGQRHLDLFVYDENSRPVFYSDAGFTSIRAIAPDQAAAS